MTCNPAFEQMFGYRQQEVIGQDLDNLVAPADRVDETRALTARARQGEMVHVISQRRTRDGTLLDVEVFGIPVVLWGRQVGILVMYHNISELVRSQSLEAAAQPVLTNAGIAPKSEPASIYPERMQDVAKAEKPTQEETTETPVDELEAAPSQPGAPGYRVEEIEGIGAVYAAVLVEAGINTTTDLLEAACTRKGRKDLAQKTGIPEKLILKWANRADLMRVPGIGEQYSDLLEAAGVDTIKELRRRVPENLYEALCSANESMKLAGRAPHLSEVRAWIEAAKAIEPRMSY